ncbi:hypothetical protein ACFL56_00820 [Candidatus Margulisiibacteriota bacterium]
MYKLILFNQIDASIQEEIEIFVNTEIKNISLQDINKYKEGLQHKYKNENKKALKIFKKLKKKYPNNILINSQISLLYYLLNKIKKSFKIILKFLDKNTYFEEMPNGKIVETFSPHLNKFQQYICPETKVEAFNIIGKAFAKSGDTDAAYKYFWMALETDPNNTDAAQSIKELNNENV